MGKEITKSIFSNSIFIALIKTFLTSDRKCFQKLLRLRNLMPFSLFHLKTVTFTCQNAEFVLYFLYGNSRIVCCFVSNDFFTSSKQQPPAFSFIDIENRVKDSDWISQRISVLLKFLSTFLPIQLCDFKRALLFVKQ